MKKWEYYTCYTITWWWEEINEWLYEIITCTEKTYKLKQIEEWFENNIWKSLKKFCIWWKFNNHSNQTIKYIEEDWFVIYPYMCWLPYIFKISQ